MRKANLLEKQTGGIDPGIDFYSVESAPKYALGTLLLPNECGLHRLIHC